MNYLVCNYLIDDVDVPSDVRECQADDETQSNGICGTHVWVRVTFLPFVDAGKLDPICWICHVKMGGTFLRIHPDEMQMLVELDRVHDALAIVHDMKEDTHNTVSSGMIQRATDE